MMARTLTLLTGIALLAAALAADLSAPAAAERPDAFDRYEAGGISWVTPDGWTSEKGSSTFRFATIAPGDGGPVIAVSNFPGDITKGAVGGVKANLNRWRRQVGLPAEADPAESDDVTEHEIDGAEGLVCDYEGRSGRLIGLMLPDPDGQRTWFFKMLGQDKDRVGKQKDDYRTVIESIRFE